MAPFFWPYRSFYDPGCDATCNFDSCEGCPFNEDEDEDKE